MEFQKVRAFILDKLSNELPEYLTYHTVGHVKDVFAAAENLGTLENISDGDKRLLLTAALFHDSGFIVGIKNHEESSCRIASDYLPGYGYTTEDITKISGMIMATKLPQLPHNLLEEIICDADLDYLGRDDFFPISDSLFEEFKITGVINDEHAWNKLQVSFFESHHYFTASALKLRLKKKEENLLLIREKIKDR